MAGFFKAATKIISVREVVVVVATAVVVSVATCSIVNYTWGLQTVLANRPECPHSWDHVYDSTVYNNPLHITPLVDGQFSLPAAYTNVPEFHDCQRLIVSQASGLSYGELGALFLSANVIEGKSPVSLTGSTSTITSQAQSGFNTGTKASNYVPGGLKTTTDKSTTTSGSAFGIPYVEVVSEGPYGILGIDIGFNCMYLQGVAGMPSATMISVGLKEMDCATLTVTSAMKVTPLAVSASAPETDPKNVPAVARWDWDPTLKIELISVPCGARSCTVGPFGWTVDATGNMVPGTGVGFTAMAARGTAADPATKRVKGWYDEQFVAYYSSGAPVVSDNMGTVFPDPLLKTYTEPDYENDWKVVAYVALGKSSESYISKYGFQQADPLGTFTSMNQVSLCKPSANCPGTRTTKVCAEGMWYAETKFGAQEARYFCVMMRTYPTGTISPGVVRWRWMAKDETLWISCPLGCCEVEGDS